MALSSALEDAGGLVRCAVAVAFGAMIVAALRWNVLLHAADLPASNYDAIRAFVIGTFANNFLPSAYGGDAVRAWLVARSGKPPSAPSPRSSPTGSPPFSVSSSSPGSPWALLLAAERAESSEPFNIGTGRSSRPGLGSRKASS